MAITGRLPCVIDGGKGLRKALGDVLGDSEQIAAEAKAATVLVEGWK